MMENQDLHLSEAGEQIIKHFEQCRLKAYADSGGKYTIGFGTTTYESGKPVRKGDTITQGRADALFKLQIPKYEQMVRERITRPLSVTEFDSLVSFAYNAGTGYMSAGKWKYFSLWENVNEGMSGDALYNYWTKLAITAGGKIIPGLIRRRKAEVTLYLTGQLNLFE